MHNTTRLFCRQSDEGEHTVTSTTLLCRCACTLTVSNTTVNHNNPCWADCTTQLISTTLLTSLKQSSQKCYRVLLTLYAQYTGTTDTICKMNWRIKSTFIMSDYQELKNPLYSCQGDGIWTTSEQKCSRKESSPFWNRMALLSPKVNSFLSQTILNHTDET